MSKVRVQLFGQARGVPVDTRATEGAVVGRDLRWPDGRVVEVAELRGGEGGGEGDYPVTYWRLVQEIPPNVTALQHQDGAGLYVLTGPGGSATRTLTTSTLSLQNASGVAGDPVVDLGELEDAGTGALLAVERDQYGRVAGTKPATITGVEGEVTVEHGDAVGGMPAVGLADVPDEGGGALQRFQRDGKGRVAGTSEATTDDLPEGSGNRYFTDERARAAAPIQSLVAGTNVSIDTTDPENPVISASGGGSGGAVESVNGKTGVVELDAADVGAATAAQGEKADSALQTAVLSLVSGANVSIDASDPENPVISATGGGADGKSAYRVAVDNGFVGTEQEWLDSLVGPEGPQGPAGPGGSGGILPMVNGEVPPVLMHADDGSLIYSQVA